MESTGRALGAAVLAALALAVAARPAVADGPAPASASAPSADPAADALIREMEQAAARARVSAAIDGEPGSPPGTTATPPAVPEVHETTRLTDAGRQRVRNAAQRLRVDFLALANHEDLAPQGKAAGGATPRALVILPPLDTRARDNYHEFNSNGDKAASYFRGQGMAVRVLHDALWEDVRQELEDAGKEGRPFDRVVIVSHGGWDGPILGRDESNRQISGNQVAGVPVGGEGSWAKLTAAVAAGTTPDARIYLSACHAGGHDPSAEQDALHNGYRYVDDLAARTQRFVAGPDGITSASHTMELVQAADGRGVSAQPVRVVSPGGALEIPGPGATRALGAAGKQALHDDLARLQRGEPVAARAGPQGPRTGIAERVGTPGD